MPVKKRKQIGAVLKAARLRLKLRAEEVAASANVSRSRVYMWEASDYVFPKNLRTLAEVLQVPVEQLEAVNRHPE